MSEPVSSVIAANVIATATGAGIIIFGVHTGLEYPTVIAGIAGGALALSYLPTANGFKRAMQVFSAALLAGYGAPFLTGILVFQLRKWGWIDTETPTQGGELVVAVILAFLAHGVILPGIQKWAKNFAGRATQ